MKKTAMEAPSEYNGYGSWHSGGVVKLNEYALQVEGMITGCGLGQMRDLAYLNFPQNKNITKEQFLKSFSSFKNSGMGAVLCTLGDNVIHLEPRLLELGLVKIAEYPNYRHSSSYIQRLYILKL